MHTTIANNQPADITRTLERRENGTLILWTKYPAQPWRDRGNVIDANDEHDTIAALKLTRI